MYFNEKKFHFDHGSAHITIQNTQISQDVQMWDINIAQTECVIMYRKKTEHSLVVAETVLCSSTTQYPTYLIKNEPLETDMHAPGKVGLRFVKQ